MDRSRQGMGIMVVEDSPEEFEFLRRTFNTVGLKNPVYHCTDGDTALDYLFGRGDYADRNANPLPGLILLDLNMPGTDGREVLQDLKSHEELRKIPIIVLTTSTDQRDIDACYEAGANSYIKKPAETILFAEAIKKLTDFWIDLAVLPRASNI